jgi:glycerol kinase
MDRYILALDQGTTSSRAVVFNRAGSIVAMAQKEFRQFFPRPGWVEHDPMEIWGTQLAMAHEAIARAGIAPESVAAIGITNQRETTVIWDRKTGVPVYPAIVWQDRRTEPICASIRKEGLESFFYERTGLIVDAYFSGTKIRWILDQVPGARQRAIEGELCFGTIDSWLLWKLTDDRVHATDISNASRTLLCNIHTGEWDEELLRCLDIPLQLLPEIKANSEVFGHTDLLGGRVSVPISGMAGDQQSALFGQRCLQPGMVKNTYGTGCFMLMQTGEKPVMSQTKLLATVAWKLNGRLCYALEGSVSVAGAIVQWLRDGLGIIRSSDEVDTLAGSVSDNGGVYLVPALTGLGAPYWKPEVRGALFGISRGTTAGHIARAALESIAYQTADVLRAMEKDAGMPIKELRVDGGAAVNNLLMQFQSDILGTPVLRPGETESTALGAALFAGLAIGFWDDADEVGQVGQTERVFYPVMSETERERLYDNWIRSVKAAIAF